MSERTNYREHEMVKRYVYDVTRRINEKQREDIAEELGSLIEDMILEKLAEEEASANSFGKSDEEVIKEVLTQMGDPAKLARKYKGEEDHLLGGVYYDMYCLVLKIILLCSGIGYAISCVVSGFVEAVELDGVTSIVTEQVARFSELPGILISTFGAVTLIFVFMERTKVKLGDNIKWDVSKLPLIPEKKYAIKRSDCITDIVFAAIFLCIFAFAPTLLGLWIVRDNQTICIPIFNLAIWSTILPIFIISFFMGIIRDIVKLMEGCYNKAVLIVTVITDAISIVCTILIFKGFALWNPDFVEQIKKAYDVQVLAKGDLVIYFGDPAMNTIFMVFVLVGISVDLLVTLIKTILRSNRI